LQKERLCLGGHAGFFRQTFELERCVFAIWNVVPYGNATSYASLTIEEGYDQTIDKIEFVPLGG